MLAQRLLQEPTELSSISLSDKEIKEIKYYIRELESLNSLLKTCPILTMEGCNDSPRINDIRLAVRYGVRGMFLIGLILGVTAAINQDESLGIPASVMMGTAAFLYCAFYALQCCNRDNQVVYDEIAFHRDVYNWLSRQKLTPTISGDERVSDIIFKLKQVLKQVGKNVQVQAEEYKKAFAWAKDSSEAHDPSFKYFLGTYGSKLFRIDALTTIIKEYVDDDRISSPSRELGRVEEEDSDNSNLREIVLRR